MHARRYAIFHPADPRCVVHSNTSEFRTEFFIFHSCGLSASRKSRIEFGWFGSAVAWVTHLPFCAHRSASQFQFIDSQRSARASDSSFFVAHHPIPYHWTAGAADTIHSGGRIIFFLYHSFLLLADPLLPIPPFPDRVPPAPPI